MVVVLVVLVVVTRALAMRVLSPPVMQLEHTAVKFTCCSCKQEKAHSSCCLSGLEMSVSVLPCLNRKTRHDATRAEKIRTERCTGC